MTRDRAAWHAGWDEHARAQRRRLAELPLSEKLDWLEEADALVRHLLEQRRPTAESANERKGPAK